jgi:hypothetical protein
MFSPNDFGRIAKGILQILGFCLISFIIGFILGAIIF